MVALLVGSPCAPWTSILIILVCRPQHLYFIILGQKWAGAAGAVKERLHLASKHGMNTRNCLTSVEPTAAGIVLHIGQKLARA